MTAPSAIPPPALVADIGGTNARFALVDGDRPRDVVSVRCADTPDIVEAVNQYLDGRDGPRPRRACFAVAAPVDGDAIALTNGPWAFSIAEVRRDLALDSLRVVNDFAAQAASLQQLAGDDLLPLGDARRADKAVRVILGPGTGLGIAAAVPAGDHWVVVPGEGGHTGFAPCTALERQVAARVAERHGRTSNERLLSGSGLVEIHHALAHIEGRDAGSVTPASITSAALDGSSSACERTVALFLDMLAALAGDVALYFGATGGVHIAGGIVPRIAGLIDVARFRRRFADKGRMAGYTATIATSVVVTPHAGLVGAGVLLDGRDAT